MAKKCSIPGCRSNYDPPKNSFSVSKAHVKVFRLPKSTSELELWLHSIPFKNLNLHKDLKPLVAEQKNCVILQDMMFM